MIWPGHKKDLEAALGKAAQLEAELSRLRADTRLYAVILDNMAEGVISVDKDSRILSVNPAVQRIFGVTADVTGRLFLEAIPNNDLYEIITAVIRGAKAVSSEIRLVWPVQRIFRVNCSPIAGEKTVSGCLLVIHDITDMRKLETVRADFVANVSHELKTPLTSIKGFVETLLEGAIDDKENSREFLRIIEDHTDRLNSLVNDLLELSYLESRQVTLSPEQFDLRQLADEVVSGFRSQLKKRSLAVENLVEPVRVTADKNRICQVLTNLIDNAIKYTKEQTLIQVSGVRQDGAVRVAVKDQGPGIPAKDIPRLFERFYRVDKARSREMGGTGLGLSIVKHIVELHGGSVGVESEEGFGASFWFTIPIK